MKKNYTKPFAEIVEFETKESIMDINIGDEDVDDGGMSGGFDDSFWD